jgi:hypothetical protein
MNRTTNYQNPLLVLTNYQNPRLLLSFVYGLNFRTIPYRFYPSLLIWKQSIVTDFQNRILLLLCTIQIYLPLLLRTNRIESNFDFVFLVFRFWNFSSPSSLPIFRLGPNFIILSFTMPANHVFNHSSSFNHSFNGSSVVGVWNSRKQSIRCFLGVSIQKKQSTSYLIQCRYLPQIYCIYNVDTVYLLHNGGRHNTQIQYRYSVSVIMEADTIPRSSLCYLPPPWVTKNRKKEPLASKGSTADILTITCNLSQIHCRYSVSTKISTLYLSP